MQFILSLLSNFARQRILNRYRALLPSIRRRQEALRDSDPATLTATLRQAPELDVVDACAAVLVTCDQLKGQTFPVLEENVVWNIIPFDSQILGGLVLFHNQIAEMGTGEGKTLSAVIAAYLSFLRGRKVHIITANEYLAQRDSIWMKPVFDKLGCTVGLLAPDQTLAARQAAYRCDVLYATASALAFDYLGDNGLITAADQRLQQGLDFAIVDEADSVLIDEARTPLVISGRKESDLTLYTKLHKPVLEVHKLQAKYVAGLEQAVAASIAAGNFAQPDLGRNCFLIRQADPNNERLQEWLQESPIRKRMEEFQQKAEASSLSTAELHNQGYYSINPRDHSIQLSDSCQEQFAKLLGHSLVIPDLSAQISRLEQSASSEEEKQRQREALAIEMDTIAAQLNTIHQLIKAYALYRRDIEYIVRDSTVVLIDSNTGRPLPGRHFSDGLHQAVELKERLRMSPESQTLAETSIQNYIRQYKYLGGMTGTARIDADEFLATYKLDVIPIPPHKKCIRRHHPDLHFMTQAAKLNRIVADIREIHGQGRPILVGTASVQESEQLSARLKALGLEHAVLNAKNHAREATIIAQAGRQGAITIATSMAGRGTDIKLAPESVRLGGLHIVGTTRYYLRRLDEQLLGRCARQGDPGSVQFYLSLEDDLLKEAKVPVARYMGFFKAEDPGIHHLFINKIVEEAQAKFSGYFHSARRQLVAFDNIVATQRQQIFAMRNDIIDGQLSTERLLQEHLADLQAAGSSGLAWFKRTFPISFQQEPADTPALLVEIYRTTIDQCATQLGFDKNAFDQMVLLANLDASWRDYITALGNLKEGAQLMSYAQTDPIADFGNKSAKMFIEFLEQYRSTVFKRVFPTIAQLRNRPRRH
jgi:preprotein translocase subunit SecA